MALMDSIRNALGIGSRASSAPTLTPEQAAVTPMSSGSITPSNTVNGTFENAIANAIKHGRPQFVDANGLKNILVDPQSTVDGLMETYNTAQKAAYNDGPEAASKVLADSPEQTRLLNARHEQSNQKTSQLQQQMDNRMADLPQKLQEGRDSTVAWIGSFAEAADRSGVTYNRAGVTSAFQNAGYSKDMVHDNSAGAAGLGNRIIGALMEQLESPGTPHPGLAQKCAEYAQASSHEKAKGVAAAIRQGMDAPAKPQQQAAPQHNAGHARG